MRRWRGIIIIAVAIGLWLTTEALLKRRTVPPTNVTDIYSFVEWRQDTEEFAIIEGDGGEHLLALGPGGGLLPSGPSGYVFDRSGQLVDWTSDIGDFSRFKEKWQPYRRKSHLRRAEVSAWLEDQSQVERRYQ